MSTVTPFSSNTLKFFIVYFVFIFVTFCFWLQNYGSVVQSFFTPK